MKRFKCWMPAWLIAFAGTAIGQDDLQETASFQVGDLSVLFRDNAQSPATLSGIDTLLNIKSSPGFDAFDPDTKGASAGLNFEHIISGHKSRHNKFTPRHGRYSLHVNRGDKSVTLVRKAADSPWSVDSTLKYTLVDPHYIDFEFRCVPRDAGKFGTRGYALFFFANYMNDVADAALHFLGKSTKDGPEQWISADAPKGPTEWNGGGNYLAEQAAPLSMDDDVEFRLNTWTYDWPRISQPFYYGLADKGMTLILMFDRLHSERDQIRFSLYKFKLPRHPRPAWDFQYVVNRVKTKETYRFRGRLVWKKFVDAADCRAEYEKWSAAQQANRVKRLRGIGATVFEREGKVVEVNANRSRISNDDLDDVSQFTQMTDLSLESTDITDAGIGHLSNLHELEWLNLYRCPVGNETLRILKELQRLQHLPIGGSRISDEGLKHLSHKTNLLYLGLRNTNITDEGLQYLIGLRALAGLHLAETKVTDKGLRHLVGMQGLKKLWLDETHVSDAGIGHVIKLRGLVELHIENTKISSAGIKRLRESLPRCEINGD